MVTQIHPSKIDFGCILPKGFMRRMESQGFAFAGSQESRSLRRRAQLLCMRAAAIARILSNACARECREWRLIFGSCKNMNSSGGVWCIIELKI